MTETDEKEGRITEFDVAFGKALREARIGAGLSQKELGAKIGATYQQVFKYERGMNRVSVGRLVQIANALDVTASDLIERASSGGTGTPKRASLELVRATEGLPVDAVVALTTIAKNMQRAA